ncbi:hypothetical protein YC2023_017754 [Brassica napus]
MVAAEMVIGVALPQELNVTSVGHLLLLALVTEEVAEVPAILVVVVIVVMIVVGAMRVVDMMVAVGALVVVVVVALMVVIVGVMVLMLPSAHGVWNGSSSLPSSYAGGPPSYGGPTGGYGGDAPGTGGRGGRGGSYDGDSAPRRQEPSYGDAPAEKVKQCDKNCDNAIIFINNLPPDVTTDELKDLFGGIGQVGRIKQKRGYKDQRPYNIKIYTVEMGKNKGDACLAYEQSTLGRRLFQQYDIHRNAFIILQECQVCEQVYKVNEAHNFCEKDKMKLHTFYAEDQNKQLSCSLS